MKYQKIFLQFIIAINNISCTKKLKIIPIRFFRVLRVKDPFRSFEQMSFPPARF